MPFYGVIVHGRWIRLRSSGDDEPHGFYTGAFVEAEDEAAAIDRAFNDVAERLREHPDILYKKESITLEVDEIYETSGTDARLHRKHGFIFYRERA